MTAQDLDIAQIIFDQVQKGDRDRFRLIIMCAKGDQPRLLALVALNLELSQCLTNTEEDMLSQIKLQWWHDALSQAADGQIRRHPVIEQLAACGTDFNSLLPMVTLRQDAVESDAKPSLKSTLDYAAGTAGQLHQIMAGGETSRESMKEIGTAWGLISLVRGLLFQKSLAEGLIPTDILDQMQGEKSFDGDMDIVMETAAKSLIDHAEKALNSARLSLRDQKRTATEKALSKLGIIAEHYAFVIKKSQYKPALIDFDRGQFSLIVKLMFKSF